jgi:DNA-directed RNA polymerase specialized sigma24 family protein
MEHSVKHLRAVLSVARTILMNLADAEEVAQEAVLKPSAISRDSEGRRDSAHG